MLEVTFRQPQPDDETEIAEAQRTMAGEGFTFAFGYTPGEDFSKWLEFVAVCRSGENLAPGMVAATFEVAVVESRVAGRLSVRHALNDFLLQQGGHIGYQVLQSFRGRGIGKRMLQRGLQITAAQGVERVLVTCAEGNAASRRIIESAGGVYESSYVAAGLEVRIRRYWFG